jgi:hypothetical protein
MHLCFGGSLAIAMLLAWRAGDPPSHYASQLLVIHLISGLVLGSLAYIYLRFRRHQAPGVRLVAFCSGALLLALTLLSILSELLLDRLAYN